MVENFVLSSMVIPAGAYIINLAIRIHCKLLNSTGSDILLTLIVFDLACLLSIETVKKLIPNSELADNLPTVFTIAVIFTILFWLSQVLTYENLIAKIDAKPTGNESGKINFKRAVTFLEGLAFTLAIVTAHICIFSWSGEI